MLEEDRKLLNKYRLNYFCITTPHHKAKSKEDLITIARELMPKHEEQVDQFQKEYNIALKGKDAHSQVLKWAFADSFYWLLVERLPKATIDPKRLAYLRLPFTDLYQAIFETKVQKDPEVLYLVTYLNLEEVERMHKEDALDNFVIFTSFMKGFTKKSDAIKEFKES